MEQLAQADNIFHHLGYGGSKARAVLLVTCLLDEFMNSLLSRIGAHIDRKTPPLSNWDIGSLPHVSENLCFSRHMAVCLLEEQVWTNRTMTFKDRFKLGRFWDHQGSGGISKRPGNSRNSAG